MSYKNQNELNDGVEYYWFLTVNPKEEEILERLMLQTNLFVKRFYWAAYCYEQRGKTRDEIGRGKHMHMLFHDETLPEYEIMYWCMKYFRELCGNDLHVNLQKVPRDDYYDVLSYIKGYKGGEPKETSKIDYFWRKNRKLKMWYLYDDYGTLNYREKLTSFKSKIEPKGKKSIIKLLSDVHSQNQQKMNWRNIL